MPALFVILEERDDRRQVRGEPIVNLAGQIEPFLEHGHLGHLDRQAMRPQRGHCLHRQVLEPDGVAPVEAPGRAPQQRQDPDRPLQRRRQRDGGEAPVAGVNPCRLVGR